MEDKSLPTRWRFEMGRRDESLSEILRNLSIPDSDVYVLYILYIFFHLNFLKID